MCPDPEHFVNTATFRQHKIQNTLLHATGEPEVGKILADFWRSIWAPRVHKPPTAELSSPIPAYWPAGLSIEGGALATSMSRWDLVFSRVWTCIRHSGLIEQPVILENTKWRHRNGRGGTPWRVCHAQRVSLSTVFFNTKP